MRNIWRKLASLGRDESGVIMLETVLVFPIQLFLTLAIIQLALVWSASNIVNYAAFQAARTGMVHIRGNTITDDAHDKAYSAAVAVTSCIANPASKGSAPNVTELRTMHHTYYLSKDSIGGLDLSLGFESGSSFNLAVDDNVVTAAVRYYFPMTVPVVGGMLALGVKETKVSSTGLKYIPIEQVARLPKPWVF